MKLSSLDWTEGKTVGALKSVHSVAEARFAFDGQNYVAVEWFRRTGHPFHPYASLVLIAEECDKTLDAALLRSIAFGAHALEEDGKPRAVHSETLGRKVILIADAKDHDLDISPVLAEIS